MTGIALDVFIKLTGKQKISYVLAGPVGAIISMLGIFGFMVLLGLPSVERLSQMLGFLLIIYSLIGFSAGWIGVWVYNKKLKDKPFIKQIQN